MPARPANVWGRISEQKSENSYLSGFQAFGDPEKEFEFSQKTTIEPLKKWNRTDGSGRLVYRYFAK